MELAKGEMGNVVAHEARLARLIGALGETAHTSFHSWMSQMHSIMQLQGQVLLRHTMLCKLSQKRVTRSLLKM